MVMNKPPTALSLTFKERYHFWMPTKGKADIMFVQHRDQLA
jgi:hypothetical protein